MDDRDRPLGAEDVPGVVSAGGRRLGGEATAPQVGADVVADFHVNGSVDFLGNQTAVADEFTCGPQRDQPAAEAHSCWTSSYSL